MIRSVEARDFRLALIGLVTLLVAAVLLASERHLLRQDLLEATDLELAATLLGMVVDDADSVLPSSIRNAGDFGEKWHEHFESGHGTLEFLVWFAWTQDWNLVDWLEVGGEELAYEVRTELSDRSRNYVCALSVCEGVTRIPRCNSDSDPAAPAATARESEDLGESRDPEPRDPAGNGGNPDDLASYPGPGALEQPILAADIRVGLARNFQPDAIQERLEWSKKPRKLRFTNQRSRYSPEYIETCAAPGRCCSLWRVNQRLRRGETATHTASRRRSAR